MKAISLWQPWASLIACGAKPFETRHWAPPRELIGQTIAIHAAKKIDREIISFAEELVFGQHEAGGFDLGDKLEATHDQTPDELYGIFGQATLPIGCIVCTATLAGAYQCGGLTKDAAGRECRVVASVRDGSRHQQVAWLTAGIPVDDFGDYYEGRWAWWLTNVKPLNPPIAATGRQGFFDLPQGWLAS
jgi:hypothetical protein